MRKSALAAFIAPALAAFTLSVQAFPTFDSIAADVPEPTSAKRYHVRMYGPAPGQEHLFQKPGPPVAESSALTKPIPLKDLYNTLYYSVFFVGANQQKITAIQDTGSSNIWFTGPGCTSPACQGKDQFNPSASPSYNSKGEKISIQYGSGNMTGTVGYDYVAAGGLNVTDQGFGVANQLSKDFTGMPFDGVFGLAYKSISEDQITPWLDNAVEQGKIDKAVFSFYLSNTPEKGDSRLIIGKPDPDYYSGEITWHPLAQLAPDVPAEMYYNIAFDGIAAGSVNIPLSCHQGEASCRAIVDSGTSYIIGPAEDVWKIFRTLSIRHDCSNLDSQPVLRFTIGGHVYEVPPKYYIVRQPDESGKLICVPAIAGEKDLPLWIFGDSFMRAFYTVFDKTDARVGFAKLSDKYAAVTQLRRLNKRQ